MGPVITDWLGVQVPQQYYCHQSYYRQRWAHALRTQLCDFSHWATTSPNNVKFPLELPLPTASEEYFEYVDVLEAVVDYTRSPSATQRPFVMLELGAGFGFWTLTAHAALRQLLPAAKYEYVLAEVDTHKLPVLHIILNHNRVSLRNATIIHAAVGDRDEKEGVLQNGNPGFYAVHPCDPQHADFAPRPCETKGYLVPRDQRNHSKSIRNGQGVPADVVSLPTLLKNFSRVDLIDMDIQGSEWPLFGLHPEGVGDEDETSAPPGVRSLMDLLDEKVLRVHIGTHGVANTTAPPELQLPLRPIEAALVNRFVRRGWEPMWTVGVTNGACHDAVLPMYDGARKHFRSTPWGPVCMADGAFGFINSRLRAAELQGIPSARSSGGDAERPRRRREGTS